MAKRVGTNRFLWQGIALFVVSVALLVSAGLLFDRMSSLGYPVTFVLLALFSLVMSVVAMIVSAISFGEHVDKLEVRARSFDQEMNDARREFEAEKAEFEVEVRAFEDRVRAFEDKDARYRTPGLWTVETRTDPNGVRHRTFRR